MKYVYLLMHGYDYNHVDGYEEFEQKFLGAYCTEKDADEAAKRYYDLPGFNKYPFECFCIEKCELDVDCCWEEGFFCPD